MVWVPDLALRSDFLGLGTALPRAVPSDAVVAVLDEVLPGMLLQKLVLYGALVLAGLGYARLVGARRSRGSRRSASRSGTPSSSSGSGSATGRCCSGTPWCPGWSSPAADPRATGRSRRSVWFLLPLGSLSASAGVVSAAVLLVCGLTRGPARTWVTLAALCVAVNAPWLVAGLRHADTAAGAAGYEVFGLHAEGSLPAPLAALGLGGIWNAEVVPGSRGGVTGLGGSGAPRRPRRARVRGRGTPPARVRGDPTDGPLWGRATCWRSSPGRARRSCDWLGDRVPGAALLRDGTRTLALCAPLVICLVGSGVTVLLGRAAGSAARIGAGVACVLLPVAMMTDAAWGLGGGLRPADYPGELVGRPPRDAAGVG